MLAMVNWQNHFSAPKSFLSRDSNDVELAHKVFWEPIQHGGDWVVLGIFCANCGFTFPDGVRLMLIVRCLLRRVN